MAHYGYRARIGYTSPPSATEVFPYEFYKIVPDGVTLVVTTMPLVERNSTEIDQAYTESLKAAAVMARAGVDLVVLGGLPINLSRGVETVDELLAKTTSEVGVPVTSSFSAQHEALHALGAARVGVCQPYDDTHNDRHLGYVEDFGLQPTGAAGAGATFAHLGTVPLERAYELGVAVKQAWPRTDTLYYPCPHWAVAGAIERIEADLGVTVVTALAAIVWQALRRCGVNDRIEGYGRLLREH